MYKNNIYLFFFIPKQHVKNTFPTIDYLLLMIIFDIIPCRKVNLQQVCVNLFSFELFWQSNNYYIYTNFLTNSDRCKVYVCLSVAVNGIFCCFVICIQNFYWSMLRPDYLLITKFKKVLFSNLKSKPTCYFRFLPWS